MIPGLIDMHVHFPPDTGLRQTELFALLFLDHGVTTVRDAGDVDGTATAPARDAAKSGAFPVPRVLACGYFVDGPGADLEALARGERARRRPRLRSPRSPPAASIA